MTNIVLLAICVSTNFGNVQASCEEVGCTERVEMKTTYGVPPNEFPSKTVMTCIHYHTKKEPTCITTEYRMGTRDKYLFSVFSQKPTEHNGCDLTLYKNGLFLDTNNKEDNNEK